MNGTPGGHGNGHDEVTFQHCRFNDSHKFTTMNARMQHEPSCPDNADRVNEWDNPDRDRN